VLRLRVYGGRMVHLWGGLVICRECERNNRDGIVPGRHPHLVSRIETAGDNASFNRDG
jgi:hypothetical protein